MASKNHGAIDDREFKEFADSLINGFIASDKDKLRKMKALCSGHTFTCKQVAVCCELTKSLWCDTAVELYKSISDPENFDEVLKVFKYEDERQEVRDRLKLPK